MISNRNDLFMNYYQSTIPSDRRSAIRRTQILTIKPSNLKFHESSKNNSFHQSPILIRRHRPTIENFSSHQQLSDIYNVYGNQLQLIRPPQLTPRNKSFRQSKPLQYSKTIHEKHISKFSHSLQTPIWSPILTEKEILPSRPLRSKSLSSRHTNPPPPPPLHHHYQLPSEKKVLIPDLFISTFKKTNVKDLVDEWEDPKSNVAVSSDDDDSIITNCNNPILHNFSKSDHFASPVFIPNQPSSRRPYNFCLPPVVEDITDEISNN